MTGPAFRRTWVVEEVSRGRDLDGLTKIGIDELSWRRGQRCITVVMDQVSGRLVWADEVRSRDTVERFFNALGKPRCALITHISSDGAEWIIIPAELHGPNATICPSCTARTPPSAWILSISSAGLPLPWTRFVERSGTAFAGRA